MNAARPTAPARPDLVVLADRVYAQFPYRRPAHAVAVCGGRVAAVGDRRAVLRMRGRRTRVLDLRDGCVTPGLCDAHTHFFYWALGRALVIDVAGIGSLEATLAKIQREAPRRRIGDWVLGRGFDQNIWGRGFPTASDLDAVVPDRPALLRSRDGHAAWLNSPALRACSVTPQTPDPPGGRYLRDERGRPTGVALESAVDALPAPIRDFAARDDRDATRVIDRALQSAYRAAWSFGVVAVGALDDAPSLAHLQRHRATGALGLRVVHSVPVDRFAEIQRLGVRGGLGDDWFRVGAVKMFADGTLGSQTAYMFDAYPGRPTDFGVPVLAGEALRAAVVAAARAGWATWIHAIGDRAVHDAVVAIAAARRVEPHFLHHRIEHTQCIRPADARAMGRVRIHASVQPCHLVSDIGPADRHWPRARRNAYAFRRLLDAGVNLALGSDVPVETIDPRRGFHGGVARTDEHGLPAGGWFPKEKLTAAEVLRGFTEGAAASLGRPAGWGTLAVGAPADMTLWASDPLRAPPTAWQRVGIRGCVVAGEVHVD
ncbi:MAG: amidohydrolase [Phycisphaerae bacterium]